MSDASDAPTTSSVEVLEAMLADAEAAMGTASGGASACSFTKAGVPVPALKYSEGRNFALRELRRALKRESPAEAVPALVAAWRAQLAALEARGAGADWVAYRTGGVDALTEFGDRVA